MMKIFYITIGCILLGTGLCFAQSGIYSIVDPDSKSLNAFGESTLGMVIGDTIEDIVITEYNGNWRDKDDAKKELIDKFQDKEVIVSSAPLWNMDMPVELIGIIEFDNGTKGNIAVAQHRVGFQDKTGRPWYFQWEERVPWEK